MNTYLLPFFSVARMLVCLCSTRKLVTYFKFRPVDLSDIKNINLSVVLTRGLAGYIGRGGVCWGLSSHCGTRAFALPHPPHFRSPIVPLVSLSLRFILDFHRHFCSGTPIMCTQSVIEAEEIKLRQVFG